MKIINIEWDTDEVKDEFPIEYEVPEGMFDIDEICNYLEASIGCLVRCFDIFFADFLDDEEKMRDFKKLSKEEFLRSYPDLTETEYMDTAYLCKCLQSCPTLLVLP